MIRGVGIITGVIGIWTTLSLKAGSRIKQQKSRHLEIVGRWRIYSHWKHLKINQKETENYYEKYIKYNSHFNLLPSLLPRPYFPPLDDKTQVQHLLQKWNRGLLQ